MKYKLSFASVFSGNLKVAMQYFFVDEILESVLNDGGKKDFDDESKEDISDIESNEYWSGSEAKWAVYGGLLTSELKIIYMIYNHRSWNIFYFYSKKD